MLKHLKFSIKIQIEHEDFLSLKVLEKKMNSELEASKEVKKFKELERKFNEKVKKTSEKKL